MKVHVQYPDGRYDYVESWKLDELIGLDQVKRFYRPSEERWIDVGVDSVRGKVKFYRRQEHKWMNLDVEGQSAWEFRPYPAKERRYRRHAL